MPEPPIDTGTLQRTNWAVIVAVVGGGVVAAAQIGKLPAALPRLRSELGLSLVEAGWVISTITAVGVFTGVVTGQLIDRIGARRIYLTGMILLATGSVWGSFATTLSTLLEARIFEGFGYIAIITSAPLLILPMTAPRDRSFAMGLWTVYYSLGISTMVIVSPWVLASVSWRGLWLVNATLAVAVASTTTGHAVRSQKNTENETPVVKCVVQTVLRPGPMMLAMAFGTFALTYLAVMAFLPTFLIERRGADPAMAAILVGMAIFMNGPGCMFGGWLLKRGAQPWAVIAIGHGVMLIAALGIYAEELPGSVRFILALLLPFAGGLVPPAVLARAPSHAASPALVATTVGLIVQIISLGQLIGPPFLAEIVTSTGNWHSATWVTTASAAIGMAAAIRIRALERRLITNTSLKHSEILRVGHVD